MRIYYKDFATGKRHWTRGTFSHWTRGGLMNAHYAVITMRSQTLFIPVYLIEKESRALLPPFPDAPSS